MLTAQHAHRSRLLVGSALLLMALPLSACSAASPSPSSSPSATATAGSDVPASTPPTETPAPALSLQPEQSAAANLEFFDSIASAVAATNPADGRAYIDALVGAGFDKTAMQLTFDRTPTDLAADSVQFSVLFNDECLIGQFGPASGGYQSLVAPVLASGTCLFGVTRQIDW
ncbi:hypothetical protein [Cryobacterium sp. CG_9.6]|uniref:DUF6993 domain-containing protein n=1 Tax=Cryobacterium sp. CG_9.6 TaxID=2760710 RepID=UPI0024768806|nr:hypothetical protein [Cryobacterium sp. CG_9.6]MDH6237428.1 hypothetical protein [Cryobacterium sp. CG_9.6]